MPFTLAHPALVLPFARSKKWSLSALVAGSMVPDFEFFFQMREVENIGHHWYGILLFDVPVALLICFVFHGFLKNLLILNLPAVFRNRLLHVLEFNWSSYASNNKGRVLIALLTGIFSHIAWDAFTHYDGFFVMIFPMLRNDVVLIGKEMPIYFLLQISSSLIGMWLVGRTLLLNSATPARPVSIHHNSWYWPLFLLAFAFIVFSRIYMFPQYNSFWGVVMAVMGGFIYAWILISILFINSQPKKLPL